MCQASLAVLSTAHKVDRSTETRLASVQLVLPSDVRGETTASIASPGERPQRRIELASFESRFSAVPPLPPHNVRKATTAELAIAPSRLQPDIQFIRFDAPTLAPMAFTQFCLKYPADCRRQRFRGDRIELNTARWLELEDINRSVNSSIRPQRNMDGLAGEQWLLGPLRGDCNDYAVTKRHQLMTKGWPARDVLLSEVVTVSGEHHLVTVVRTSGGDLVLDNLTNQIVPWSHTQYRWVRIQTPKNPNYWASISSRNA